MNRGRETALSSCERQFMLEAIKERKRLDGRSVYDYRHVTITPNRTSPGNVLVSLGQTRVQACASCEVVMPRPQRPTDGMLYFNVIPSPMASPAYETSGKSSVTIRIERLLDRCFKESRSIDTESLCIIAGQKVWSVRVDLHILNDCGNVTDCCVMASLISLKHFKRPDVTVIGEEMTIYPVTEREPVPLNIHHLPLSVTFGFCCDGDYLLVDPTHEEEQVLTGHMSLVMNVHREICTLQLEGGVALLPDQVIQCTKIALTKVNELSELVKSSLTITMETNHSILTSMLHESSEAVEKIEAVEENQDCHETEEIDLIIIDEDVGEIPCDVLSFDETSAKNVEPAVNWKTAGDDSEEDNTMILTSDELGFTKKPTSEEGPVKNPATRRKRKKKN